MIGEVATQMHLDAGVDLRCGVTVTALEGDAAGRVRSAALSDGSTVEADVVIVSLGAIRNTDWLAGSGLGAGPRGIACDAGCRAFDVRGIVTDDVFVAGDVARSPHPLFGYQFLSLEHWGNAVAQAEVAAHNMINAAPQRLPHLWVPAFWSSQFGVNIKSVGVPSMGEEIMVTQGSLAERRFTAVYGHQGRVIAAVTFDHGRWLPFYEELIQRTAPFPPPFETMDRPQEGGGPRPAGFPTRPCPRTAPRSPSAATPRPIGPSPSPPRGPDRRHPTVARRPAPAARRPRPALPRPPTRRRPASRGPSRGHPAPARRARCPTNPRTVMTDLTLLQQITDYSNRHDPYPLYARLREKPVHHDESGPYVIGGYHAVRALLHDPRISSEARYRAVPDTTAPGQEEGDAGGVLPPNFLRLDPPEHDRLRAITNRPFGPPHSPHRIDGMHGELETIVTDLIDALDGDEIDLVDRFSYPFPVTVICRLLGIPREDESRFHGWADTLVATLDPQPGQDLTERNRIAQQARVELGLYLNALIEERRKAPGDDMLSQLATGQGPEGG